MTGSEKPPALPPPEHVDDDRVKLDIAEAQKQIRSGVIRKMNMPNAAGSMHM